MIRIIEKVIDYYLARTITNKIIFLFVSSGIFLVAQNIFGQLFEQWLNKEFGVVVPDLKFWGAGFIVIGLTMLAADIKFSLLPSIFATTKTTRIIYLGEGKYQFVFEKRLRTIPVICFEEPKHSDNAYSISSCSENGFIVQFEKGKKLSKIEFWADAWEGLNLQQKAYILLINIFRRKDQKLQPHEYASSFANRQIKKLNNT
ncbi:MAG: hypothetical protein GY787_25490 [Alteromonadales bacterium]|nr:hypothetical protein [Alteromonadales bacterium]